MKKLAALVLAVVICLAPGAPALAAGAVLIPDPAALMGEYVQSAYYEDYDYAGDEGAKMVSLSVDVAAWDRVQEYLDQLEQTVPELEAADFTDTDGEDGYTAVVSYIYNGGARPGTVTSPRTDVVCNVCVMLVINHWSDDTFYLDVYYGSGIGLAQGGAPAPAASAVTSGDGILPDAHAFFDGELTHSEESITNGTKAVFSVEQEYAAAAYEYVELLKSGRFGLSLAQTLTDDHSGADLTTVYVFDYTGSGDVDPVSLYTDGRDVYGAVIVRVNDWPEWGWCEMSIRFSDGLTVADTGDRCTVTGLVDDTDNGFSGPMGGGYASGGSSGSGIDWYIGDDGGRKCSVCNGTGSRDCMTCDGKGYIEEYVSVPNYSGSTLGSLSGWEHHDCPNAFCHDGQVDCITCGGDGWID